MHEAAPVQSFKKLKHSKEDVSGVGKVHLTKHPYDCCCMQLATNCTSIMPHECSFIIPPLQQSRMVLLHSKIVVNPGHPFASRHIFTGGNIKPVVGAQCGAILLLTIDLVWLSRWRIAECRPQKVKLQAFG